MTSTSNNYNNLHNNSLHNCCNLHKANNASNQTTNVLGRSANAVNQAIDEIVVAGQNKLGNSANRNHNINSEITDISQSMSSSEMPRSGIYRKL